MPRFLVRNNRPRKPIVLFGRTLRAARPSQKVTAGEMWLDSQDFESDHVTKLLRLQRLKVVDCKGATMGEVQEYIARIIFPDDVKQETPEPSAEPADLPEEEEALGEESAEEDSLVFTREELEEMNYRKELQPLAKDLGLSSSGSKEDLVERILAYQEGN